MIGAARLFAPRMFAPRYWPKVGATAAAAPTPLPPLYALVADDGQRRVAV